MPDTFNTELTFGAWEADRVIYNNWVRGGALGTQYLEWADTCEPTRDAGRWVTCLQSSLLCRSDLLGTVTQIITANTRFRSTGPNVVGNGAAGGILQWASGANIGTRQSVNGSSGANDITLASAPPNPITIGDTFYIESGSSRATADGTHPRVAVAGRGGQELIVVPTTAWLAARLA